jgi:hypothetical protein
MGRRPIGKRAMTSGERQRRFLDKLRGTQSCGSLAAHGAGAATRADAAHRRAREPCRR